MNTEQEQPKRSAAEWTTLLKSCTWKHGCQNHNYVQGGQGVQY